MRQYVACFIQEMHKTANHRQKVVTKIDGNEGVPGLEGMGLRNVM